MRHHMVRRSLSHEQGQVNVTAALLLVAVVVTCVWVWKRLPLETQDYLTDQALPLAAIIGPTWQPTQASARKCSGFVSWNPGVFRGKLAR